MVNLFGMRGLDKIIDDISGIPYDMYIDYIREKNKYKHASYSGRIKIGTMGIPKELLFPTMYFDYFDQEIINIINTTFSQNIFQQIDEAIITLYNDSIYYEENHGIRRNDIYEDKKIKSKIPESIFLYNPNNKKIEKKLVENRPYIKNVGLYMNRLEKNLDRKLSSKIYLPTVLFLAILLTEYKKYFPHMIYVSYVYYQFVPTCFNNYYCLNGINNLEELFSNTSKTLIEPDKNLLSVLTMYEIVKYPTLEPYMLNLPYDFELEKFNLRFIDLELDFDEVKYRFRKSLDKILRAIIDLKSKPLYLSPGDIAIGENLKFIDFGSGFIISLDYNSLKSMLVESLLEIIEGLLRSPLLRMCEKNGNKLVCNPNVKNPFNIKEFIDLPKDIYYMLFTMGINKELIDKIGKCDIIKEHLDTVNSLSDDEFDLMRRYSSEVVKLYNNFPVDDYIKYHK